MFQRKTTGSVVCPSCGSLVGVRDDKCYTCGRANPGLWGFGPVLRQLGADFGFVPIVIGASTVLYTSDAARVGQPVAGRRRHVLDPLAEPAALLFLFGASGAVPVFGSAAGGPC